MCVRVCVRMYESVCVYTHVVCVCLLFSFWDPSPTFQQDPRPFPALQADDPIAAGGLRGGRTPLRKTGRVRRGEAGGETG